MALTNVSGRGMGTRAQPLVKCEGFEISFLRYTSFYINTLIVRNEHGSSIRGVALMTDVIGFGDETVDDFFVSREEVVSNHRAREYDATEYVKIDIDK